MVPKMYVINKSQKVDKKSVIHLFPVIFIFFWSLIFLTEPQVTSFIYLRSSSAVILQKLLSIILERILTISYKRSTILQSLHDLKSHSNSMEFKNLCNMSRSWFELGFLILIPMSGLICLSKKQRQSFTTEYKGNDGFSNLPLLTLFRYSYSSSKWSAVSNSENSSH